MKITIELKIEDHQDYKYLIAVVNAQVKYALTQSSEMEDEMYHQGLNCSSKITIDREEK